MKAGLSSKAGALAEWIDDRLNPIVVKELRQAVQGRFVAAVLILLLTIQLSILALFLLTNGVEIVRPGSTRSQGREVFGFIYAFLLLVSIVVIPLFAAVRLFVERAGEALSLLFISTLPPRRIVAGKLMANQVLVLLMFVACLPYVSFTYFLRGIDLPSVGVVFAAGFVVVSVCLQGMILLACLPGGRVIKALIGLASLVGLMIVFVSSVNLSHELLQSGVGSRIATRDFWIGTGTFLGIAGFLLGLFFLASVALIAPEASNRAVPLRVYLSAAWLLSGIGAAYGGHQTGDPDVLEVWIVLWTLVIVGVLAVSISSRDRMSRRVARAVPAGRWRRALAFPFWSGSASGVAWASLTLVLTFVGCSLLDEWLLGPRFFDDLAQVTAFAGYGFAYPMTALSFQRQLPGQRIRPGYTWLVGVVLVILGMVGPYVVGFLISPDSLGRMGDNWQWNLLNPFAAFDRSTSETALLLALAWSLAAAAVALPWFMPQWRAYARAGRRNGRNGRNGQDGQG